MVAGWKHTFKLRIDLDQSCKNREKNRLPAPKLLGPEGAVGIRASLNTVQLAQLKNEPPAMMVLS